MSGSKFVSFSSMLKNRVTEEKPEIEEEKIDYQALYAAECKAKEALVAQVQQLQQEVATLNQHIQHQEQTFTQGHLHLEQSVALWKSEIHEQHLLVWKNFVEKFFYDARFHNIALREILAQALSDLSEQKNVIVEVPSAHVDLMRTLLQNHSNWEVLSTDDIEVGLRFKTEKIEWEEHLEPIYEEIMRVIDQLLQDVR